MRQFKFLIPLHLIIGVTILFGSVLLAFAAVSIDLDIVGDRGHNYSDHSPEADWANKDSYCYFHIFANRADRAGYVAVQGSRENIGRYVNPKTGAEFAEAVRYVTYAIASTYGDNRMEANCLIKVPGNRQQATGREFIGRGAARDTLSIRGSSVRNAANVNDPAVNRKIRARAWCKRNRNELYVEANLSGI